MQIRFRAPDFGLVAKIYLVRAKSKQFFLCGDGARVIRFFARVFQQLGFWAQKVSGAAPSPLGPGLKHPSLRSNSNLAAKSRAEAFTWCFFQQSIRPQSELLLCVYPRMIRRHERRALGALLSFCRSEPASTDS